MKKIRKNSRAAHNKQDEYFAKKVVCQIIVCVLVYVTVFTNSKLTNPVSVKINNRIKQYLCVSVDFDKVINTARVYVEKLINEQQAIPVDAGDISDSKDDN